LLNRFTTRRDESAFELLMWRHGTMVLGVCRAILRDAHHAEDAFQAAFLALARKAGSIRDRNAVAAWLCQVAHRPALRLQAQIAKTTRHEQSAASLVDLPAGADSAAAPDPELAPLLVAEVNRLPAKYRTPVVLCYLEGRTVEQAARELGWPKG